MRGKVATASSGRDHISIFCFARNIVEQKRYQSKYFSRDGKNFKKQSMFEQDYLDLAAGEESLPYYVISFLV